MIQLLGSIKILVKLLVKVRVDNTGAIFMTNNIITTPYTNHVNIKYKYVKEYMEDVLVKIVFIKQYSHQNLKCWGAWEALEENDRWVVRSVD